MAVETLSIETVRELPLALEVLASALLVAGGLFALLGSIGLLRLRDFPMRLHAPTKASTLGVGGVLLASMIVFGWWGQRLPVHEGLITLFVFFTAPVSAYVLMRAWRSASRTQTAGSDSARRSGKPGRASADPSRGTAPKAKQRKARR
jgi:multicomponent K+:H+ antiporter subunit G